MKKEKHKLEVEEMCITSSDKSVYVGRKRPHGGEHSERSNEGGQTEPSVAQQYYPSCKKKKYRSGKDGTLNMLKVFYIVLTALLHFKHTDLS